MASKAAVRLVLLAISLKFHVGAPEKDIAEHGTIGSIYCGTQPLDADSRLCLSHCVLRNQAFSSQAAAKRKKTNAISDDAL